MQAEKELLIEELTSIIEDHKTIWLYRNREVGLKDSAGKLEDLLNYLETF